MSDTAVKVYKTLENEGVIISIPSKGNFVSDDADQLQSLRVAELTEIFVTYYKRCEITTSKNRLF
jgi:GntR family transcriptional regulator